MSHDGRLLIKMIGKEELNAYCSYGPAFFQHYAAVLFHQQVSLLTEIFGVYRLTHRHYATGKTSTFNAMVMRNLRHGATSTTVFDLKGTSLLAVV